MSDPMGDPYPVRFPTATFARLAAAAARRGLTKTAAVREAVDQWLTRADNDDQASRTGDPA